MPEVVVPTSCGRLLHRCALFKQAASSPRFGLPQGCFKRETSAFSQRSGDAVWVAVKMRPHIGKCCLMAVLLDVALDGDEVEGAAVALLRVCHASPPYDIRMPLIVCTAPLGNGQLPFADVIQAEYGYNGL